MQGVLQGFRVVGSGSKLGRDYPVVAYRFGGAVELEKLLDYIPASNGERKHLQALMKKSRLSLAEAREKYPDWYERRIVKKERRGRWTVKRDLYDWWLRRIFNEDYVTFPRDDIAKISGLSMPVNKRNWRKQKLHIQYMNINRQFKVANGECTNGGRPTAQQRVYEWRLQHPEGRKADCNRDTGIDPKTIRKWWDKSL